MNKLIATVLIFVLSGLCTFSQEDYIKNKWKIKAAKSSHNISLMKDNLKEYETIDNYQLELSYGILSYLETSIYFGYSIEHSRDWHNNRNITFGVNANFHFLPFITQSKLLKFIDTYVATNIGGYYHKSEDIINFGYGYGKPGRISHGDNNTYLEYGIGGGLSLYPLDKLGIFTEYTFGNYYFKGNHRFRTGLVIRF